MRPAWPLALLPLLACEGSGDDTAPPADGPCEQASAERGELVCLHQVPDSEAWQSIAVGAAPVDQVSVSKYIAPVSPDAALPPLFVNTQVFSLHFDLLTQAFSALFPGLDYPGYIRLVLDPDHREYWAGNVAQYLDPRGGGVFFGFTVWDDAADLNATVTYAQVLDVWQQLSPRFELDALVFVPNSANQLAAAATWDAEFDIRGVNNNVSYEAYTQAVGYGSVRLYTLEELDRASDDAAFGYQDLLVLEEAPFDIERVIAGAVTGSRQGELSHLNVRSAARGTPNCFVPDPLTALAEWEGQLVRLECGEDALSIQAATLEEAEAWWDALRPEPVHIPSPDTHSLTLTGLLELPTDSPEQRALAVSRYGAKGSNLAALYQRIPGENQLQGLLVPFGWYQAYMQDSTWRVDLGQGEAEYSFQDTLDAWLVDPEFAADARLRQDRLEALRAAMRAGQVDPALLEELELQLLDTWGDAHVMVRFRSSSNAEDALAFSGAGLYQSTSACLADQLDADDEGPSLCDADQDKERSLNRAVLKVWASLWRPQAFEERQWYGIDHSQAAMGVLVNTRSAHEQANIVAFTGSLSGDDDRFVINAQLGELAVVGADPGVYPEKVLLTLQDGQVVEIERVRGSSELADGERVLSDAQLETLGALYAQIQQDMPVDEVAPEGREVLLDSEWKVLQDGALVVKQVRPFLR